jgi:ribose transport system substrate-binding protein
MALTGVTACSQPNSGGGSGNGGSSGGGNAAAEKKVEAFLSPPTDIPLNEPVNACPSPGKKIAILEIALAAATRVNDSIVTGAKSLGWTVERIKAGTGPEGMPKAFDAALDLRPDAIRETSDLEMPVWAPSARSRSSTLRVETPCR